MFYWYGYNLSIIILPCTYTCLSTIFTEVFPFILPRVFVLHISSKITINHFLLFVCVCLSLSLPCSASPYVCLPVSSSVSICPFVCLSACLYVLWCVCLFVPLLLLNNLDHSSPHSSWIWSLKSVPIQRWRRVCVIFPASRQSKTQPWIGRFFIF